MDVSFLHAHKVRVRLLPCKSYQLSNFAVLERTLLRYESVSILEVGHPCSVAKHVFYVLHLFGDGHDLQSNMIS